MATSWAEGAGFSIPMSSGVVANDGRSMRLDCDDLGTAEALVAALRAAVHQANSNGHGIVVGQAAPA